MRRLGIPDRLAPFSVARVRHPDVLIACQVILLGAPNCRTCLRKRSCERPVCHRISRRCPGRCRRQATAANRRQIGGQPRPLQLTSDDAYVLTLCSGRLHSMDHDRVPKLRLPERGELTAGGLACMALKLVLRLSTCRLPPASGLADTAEASKRLSATSMAPRGSQRVLRIKRSQRRSGVPRRWLRQPRGARCSASWRLLHARAFVRTAVSRATVECRGDERRPLSLIGPASAGERAPPTAVDERQRQDRRWRVVR
jgi:hypothetical protein